MKKINLPEETVFIIDGSHFLYRSFFSIRPLTTKTGKPVQAVYGFCKMIKKLFDTYNPKYMVLVWDSKGPTFRHEMYDLYKKTRQSMPEDLKEQQKDIREFADLVGIAQIQSPKVEADDLIYSFAKKLEEENHPSVILTADKDLSQMLSAHVSIIDPFKEIHITQASCEESFGFPVSKLPFYYGLVGDSSDNIPGVKGIGPKAAQPLVKQFDSLDHLYKEISTISSERIKNLLITSKDNAYLSEKLFTLQFQDITLRKESCSIQTSQWVQAYSLFKDLDFTSLIQDEVEIEEPAPTSLLATTYDFVLVNTPQLLKQVCEDIEKFKRFAVDTEGTSLNPLKGRMVGLSICVQEGRSYYIPFGHNVAEDQLPKRRVLQELRPFFEDEKIEKILHHAKFDALMFHTAGIHLKGIAFDTLIAARLLVPDGQRIGLKYLSESHLNEPMLTFEYVLKQGGYKSFAQVPLGIATQYAAADAHQTMRLYTLFKEALATRGLNDFFDRIEMPLVTLLFEMEKTGIYLCTDTLSGIETQVTEELEALRLEIISHLGDEHADLNLNSPKQVKNILFNVLMLPPVKKTAGKTAQSTDNEVLTMLAKRHPVPGLISRYRELFKIKSSYTLSLSEFIHPTTGKVHTSFNQTGVATGRLSSSFPNLQNIPVTKGAVRSAFKAVPGHVFISADYSQIELRVLAQVAQDKNLIQAFNDDKDIHALTASGLLDVPVDQITNQQRQIGKKINFSILYGLTPHGLAKDLDISQTLAKHYIDTFMAQYQGISQWMLKTEKFTQENGYVETYFKRRRYLPAIHEKNKTLYDVARRAAINTVAQGTAAELVKLGMINVKKALVQHQLAAKIVIQIHDELLIEVPVHEVEQTTQVIKQALENVLEWSVPLKVSIRTGKNWQEVTK